MEPTEPEPARAAFSTSSLPPGAEPPRAPPEDPTSWLRPAALLRLAVPAATAAILQNAYRPLDQVFVAGLGAEAQGALGACTFVLIVLYGIAMAVAGGVGPLVGRATGRGDPTARAEHVGAGLVGAAGVAVLMVLVGSALITPIVAGLGLSGATAAHATLYLRVLLLTGAALAFGPVLDSAFAAVGNTVLPLVLQGGIIAVNLVLTPILVYGLGLGTGGAALGSTIAQTLGVAVGLVLLVRAVDLRLEHVLAPIRTLLERVRRLVRIGLPVSAGVILYALVYWGMLATSISPLGPDVLAGLGLGFNGLETFAWPLFLGCTIAAQSLTGRFLGAGRPDLVWRALWRLVPAQLALGVGIGVLFLVAGPTLLGAVAADEGAAREAALYAMILAWSQPFVALEAISEGVLAGSGDTRTLFWTTVPFNLLRIPLAWFLAIHLGFGAAGVWWAINLTTGLKASLKAGMVLRGRWVAIKL